MSKSQEFLCAVESFFQFVSAAEQDVIQNAHRGRLPPACFGDPWNEDFVEAYAKLRPWLRPWRTNRLYPVSAGLMFCNRPISSESGCQALMFFLNPSEQLHGEVAVLDTPEYHRIKTDAIKEIDDADGRRVRKRSPKKSASRSAKKRARLTEVRALIIDHHFPKSGKFTEKCLTGEQIGDALGFSQSTASRYVSILFQKSDGMDAYNAVFTKREPPLGHRKKFDNGTLTVEAIARGDFSDYE